MGKETIAGMAGAAYHMHDMNSRNTAATADKAYLKTLLDRANTLMKEGSFDIAAQHFLELARHLPSNTEVFRRAGICLFNIRNFAAAAAALEKARTDSADDAETARLLVICYLNTGRPDDAARLAEAQLAKDAQNEAMFDLFCEALARARRWQELLDADAAWQKKNTNAAGYGMHPLTRVADAHIATGNPQMALELAEAAKQKLAENPDFWPFMGHVCQANRLFDRALDCHAKAYKNAPEDHRFISNYGLALGNMGRLDEALALFDGALASNPLLANIYVNRASIHKKRHDLKKSITDLESALEITPLSAAAHYALGCAYIQNEDYARGWPHYEWNWHVSEMPKFRPTKQLPNWYGQNLASKSLLVYVEQGIGDTVMFARYLPVLDRLYANLALTVICERKLEGLLRNSFPFVKKFLVKEDLKTNDNIEADYMVAFGSLPCILKTEIANVPNEVPYLKNLNPRKYNSADTKLIIGITWSSNSLDAGYKRSLPLESYLFFKEMQGVKLVDLQYGDTSAERATAASKGLNLLHDDTVDPFTDMQAHIDQIAACDLVISADNTTVHAAGALGKPVWTLLPYDSYWRWHLDHESTPWYPTMRLFRQDSGRSFGPVLEKLAAEIQKLLDGDKKPLDAPTFKTRLHTNNETQKTVLLLNDTSATYHWGCTATSEALKSEIRKKGYEVESIGYLEVNGLSHPAPTLQEFDSPLYLSEFRYRDPTLFASLEKAEKLVINGEGTIHGTGPNALRLLYLAYAAKTFFGKPLHIINHACFPEDGAKVTDASILAYYLKGYRAADSVVVRDPISHKILNDIGIRNTLGFDSLPLTASKWIAENGKPKREKRIILAGSSNFSNRSANAYKAMLADFESDGFETEILIGAKVAKASEDAQFCSFMDAVAGNRAKVFEARSMDEWFERIASATLLVSGRFHYSIAASCVGTPFVAFEGNTPKLHALCELLGTNPPLSYTDPELVMKLRMAVAKALRDGPASTDDTTSRLEKLCALACKNFEAI